MTSIFLFDLELVERLKSDRLLFMVELYELGETFGLNHEQIDRVISQLESSGKVSRELAVLYLGGETT
ncbi:MAG: hypothetical protein PXY39_05905 [archaeon]|nr:hypothetical protein [archaeon]